MFYGEVFFSVLTSFLSLFPVLFRTKEENRSSFSWFDRNDFFALEKKKQKTDSIIPFQSNTISIQETHVQHEELLLCSFESGRENTSRYRENLPLCLCLVSLFPMLATSNRTMAISKRTFEFITSKVYHSLVKYSRNEAQRN